MFKTSLLTLMFFFILLSCSTHHEVEVAPVRIEPIHITIDVNIKIDRALNDFFGDIDAAEEKIIQKPSENK